MPKVTYKEVYGTNPKGFGSKELNKYRIHKDDKSIINKIKRKNR